MLFFKTYPSKNNNWASIRYVYLLFTEKKHKNYFGDPQIICYVSK